MSFSATPKEGKIGTDSLVKQNNIKKQTWLGITHEEVIEEKTWSIV